MEKRICKLESCGKEFMPTIHTHLYCTKECHKKAIGKRKPFPKGRILYCKRCNKEFTPNGKCRKYCSKECSVEYSRTNNKQYCARYYIENKESQAEYCKKYRIEKADKIKIMKKEYYLKNIDTILNEENRLKRYEYLKTYCTTDGYKMSCRKHHQKRRAITSKSKISDVDFKLIIERDNGMCQLCKEKIDFTLKKPHPMSINFDHIIPLSKGGEHKTDNIQLSHQICNQRKSARIL